MSVTEAEATTRSRMPDNRQAARGRPGRRRTRIPLWMLVPCFVALALIVIIPVVMTIVLSFHGIDASALRNIAAAPFVGLENFFVAFDSQNALGVGALQSLGLSVGFSMLTTLLTLPIGFIAALTVHEAFRGRAAIRAIYLIPYVLPMFVTAILARIAFMDQNGLVDRTLGLFGFDTSSHLLLGANAFWSMVATDVWAQWPFVYLFTLAGLQGIPRELFEAAELDGAGKFQKIRLIVLPSVKHMLTLAVLLSTLHHFGNFTLAYVMFSAPPPASVMVLPISTFFYAFTTFDYGVASALAVLAMIVLLVPAYVYIRASRLAEND